MSGLWLLIEQVKVEPTPEHACVSAHEGEGEAWLACARLDPDGHRTWSVVHYDPDALVPCEMQGCEERATHYGGYAGANDWAGRVCETHTAGLAWSEVLT